MRFVFFMLLATAPAFADTATIGPGYDFKPGDACHAPVAPASNDEASISRYQTDRQKFMACAAHRPADGSAESQADLDRSLAAIGNDQNGMLDQVQQQARGTARRLGLEDSRK